SPKSGTVGTIVTVNGNGFGAVEDVRITFGSNVTITIATTNTIGLFTSGWTVDLQPYGTSSVQATGLTSGREFKDIFDISSVITNMTPTVGSITTQITISGNGFGANENIQVDFGLTSSIQNISSAVDGSFITTFTINTQVYGTKSVRVTGNTSGRTDYRDLKLVARLWQVSPTTGTVGSRITVWGDGYSDNETIFFKLGILGTVSTIPPIVKASTGIFGGTFSASFIINTQVTGTTTIEAIGSGLGKSNQTTINYVWIDGHITSVLPTSGPVGTMVTVTGDGFGRNESVQVDFGTKNNIIAVTTGEFGTFAVTFTVDTQPVGTTTIVANGSLTKDDEIFKITTGIATIAPSEGTVGTLVNITGGGYQAGELIRMSFGTTMTINTCVAAIDGWIQGSFTVNEQVYGVKTVTATGIISNSIGNINFTILHNLTYLTPIQGTVGRVITVYGNGYNEGQISLKFGDVTLIKTGNTTQDGTFAITFTINTQVYGTTTVTAIDSKGKQDADVVLILSHITKVFPTIGSVGTMVTVNGDGYANTEIIRVALGWTQTITTTTASDHGSWTTTWTVDIQPSGTASVVAYGAMDETNHQAQDLFRIRGEITLVTPAKGSVGTTITVYGNGYGASETITIDFGLKTPIVSTACKYDGTFSTTFAIDTQVFGTKTLTVTGINTADVDRRQIKVMPEIVSVSPLNGTVGTVITIYGTGYAGTGTVCVRFGTEDNVGWQTIMNNSEIETSARGTFTGVLDTTIPQAYGSTTITAYHVAATEITADNWFTITPRIYQVTPNKATVGTVITIYGDGYGKVGTVSIKFGKTLSITMGQTNSAGTFSALFTVDSQAFGTTTIIGYGRFAQAHNAENTTFQIIPRVYNVTPTIGTVGTMITVFGNGYAASETVEILFGTEKMNSILGENTTENGTFAARFAITTQVFGTKVITATGPDSKYPAYNEFFIIPEVYSVVPTVGTIGTHMTISGSGYGSGTYVYINFGTRLGTESGKQVTTQNNGTFVFIYTPEDNFPQPAGTTTITAWEEGGDVLRVATNRFYIQARIFSVSPTEGTVGTVITIKADGYSANFPVKIDFGTIQSKAVGTTSTSGTFSTTFVIDPQQYGDTAITATCRLNIAGNMCRILPNIILATPSHGSVGTMITVRGDGYGATHAITIDFGSKSGIVTPMSDRYGTFTTSFTIDLQPYGTTTIKAQDNATNPIIWVYDRIRIDTHITLVTPLSGTVGSMVSVTGNGFGASEPIRVEFGTTASITTCLSTKDGYFEVSFTVDSQSIGTNTITTHGVDTGQYYATYTFRVIPKLTGIVPTEGTVGATITLYGDGFCKSETIRIDFGSTLTMTVEANNDGSFVRKFNVNEQAYGTCSVVALGLSSNGKASIDFKIVQSITYLSPTTGTVGAFITISGQGYGNRNYIRLAFGTTISLSQKLTSAGGTFTHTFAIDTQVYGTTTLTAWDDSNNIRVDRTLFILPEIITVLPNMGTVGSIVTVSGNGYRGSNTIRVEFGSNTNRAITPMPTVVTPQGSWTTTWTVDTQSFGTTTITATDEIASVSKLYTILPEIIIVAPGSGTVGSMVTVAGNGYGSGKQIRLEFGSVTTMRYTTADVQGSWTISWTVDTQYYGTTTVGAHDDDNQLTIRKKYTILPNIILITPKAGTVGSPVTVAGNGFGKERNIRVLFGNTPTMTTTVTDGCGSWTTIFTINTQYYGTTTITAYDVFFGISASGTNTILPEIINVTPTTGTVGSVITVSGNGYGSSMQVRLEFGTTQIIATITAQVNGSFTTIFTLDTQPYGTTTITAHDDYYQVRSAKTAVILPNIFNVVPMQGSVGSTVTVKGNGYGASEPIRIEFGTTPSITSCMSTKEGYFETTFIVDSQSIGTNTITAHGVNTGQYYATYTFRVMPKLTSIVPTEGTVGTTITLYGDGFRKNETIQIDFGSTLTMTVEANADGSFVREFVVNEQAYGTCSVIATGASSSGKASIDFKILQSITYLSPTSGTVGRFITISGQGYGKSNTIRLQFGTTPTLTQTLASEGGTFTHTFTIDTQVYGTTALTAWDDNNGICIEKTLFILPEI
ncbi:hypothetical protein COZ13_02675, partial [Candidatus Desantisbacteria bacterium CG_4_10_14_3_um_filter_40_18]